jgi:hypothetical protein
MKQEKNFREQNITRVRESWNARPCNVRRSPRPAGNREPVGYRCMPGWHFRILPQALFRALERRIGRRLCLTAEPERA